MDTTFINHIIFPVVLAFIIERLWDYRKDQQKKKENFNIKKEQVIREIDYNCQPGIGSKYADFIIDEHKRFLDLPDIDKEIRNSIKAIIHQATRCNSIEKITFARNDGLVKNLSRSLKEKLLNMK